MKLSFVISTCDRPETLPVVLHSLAIQTMGDFEAIVTDNSRESQAQNKEIIDGMDKRFCHIDTSASLDNCYGTANMAVERWCSGEFLCFPSDDSYYVPVFAERMIGAAESNSLGLVYCNMVYDARFNGKYYSTIDVQPMMNSIDKTGFIIRRGVFLPFSTGRKSDGELIETLVENGIRHGKIPDVLLVHN